MSETKISELSTEVSLDTYTRVMETIMDGLNESIADGKRSLDSPEVKKLPENAWILNSIRNCAPLLKQKLEETRYEFNRVIRENDTKLMTECVNHQREIRKDDPEFAFLFE